MDQLTIDVWRDPYDIGFTCTKPRQVTFNPGLTVLVGCNGAGKTTLLHNIQEECKKNKIPCHKCDNLTAGKYTDFFGMAFEGSCHDPDYQDNLDTGLAMWLSSEGECIKINLGRQAAKYKEFAETGKIKERFDNIFSSLFNDEDEEETNISPVSPVRVLLYDAVDSGMSIDAIIEVKAFFKKVIESNTQKGLITYIITVANEYEMANSESCFDVNAGKYISFQSYEEYKKFVLRSRKLKEKRIEQQYKWIEKQRQKELTGFEKLKEKVEAEKKAYFEELKAKGEEPPLYDYTLRDIEDQLRDYARRCRFAHIELEGSSNENK